VVFPPPSAACRSVCLHRDSAGRAFRLTLDRRKSAIFWQTRRRDSSRARQFLLPSASFLAPDFDDEGLALSFGGQIVPHVPPKQNGPPLIPTPRALISPRLEPPRPEARSSRQG